MAAAAKKGWEQYMLQLQLHPLRTKVGAVIAMFISFSSMFIRSAFHGEMFAVIVSFDGLVGHHRRRAGRNQRFGGAEALRHTEDPVEAPPS